MDRETSAPKYWYLLLIGALVLLALNCWLPELSPKEAAVALVAAEMHQGAGSLANPQLLGNPVLAPPLGPWLLAAFSYIAPLNEFGVRLLGLAPLALLAVLCAYVAWRRAGSHAAAAAAAAVLTCFVALEKGIYGAGDMLFCLLINCCWLLWYRLSRERRQWLYAWFFVHLLLCLAVLAGGGKAIFFFYFPLLFLRRPLKISRRLGQPDHWVSLLAVLAIGAAWIMLSPYLPGQLLGYLGEFQPTPEPMGYLKRFVRFPARAVLGYLPWIFLVWPAFCMAFRPLEKETVFCQFLRTIVFSLTFFFWFFPGGRPSSLLPLIGPLAILLAMNYELLVRRYARQLMRLPKLMAWLAAAGVVVSLGLGAGLFFRDAAPPLPRSVLLPTLGGLLVAAGLAIAVLFRKDNRHVWLQVLAATVALHLVFAAAAYNVHRRLSYSHARDTAARLADDVPPGAPVYVMIADEPSASLCYYLRRPVQRIALADDLPIRREPVFLLGGDRVPISKFRDWTAVSERVVFRDRPIRMWRGEPRPRG